MEEPKKYILIIEPDAQFQGTLKNFFSTYLPNAKLVYANSTGEGIAKISRQKFDLVVFDLCIGKDYGIGFLEEVFRQVVPNWMIALSLIPKPKQLGNFRRVTYLSKPFDEELFKDIVSNVLGITLKKPSEIDVQFINPFIEGTLKVLKLTARIEAVKQKVFIPPNNHISGDISGIIPMESERFRGSMAVSFEEKCFLNVVSSMLEEEQKEITAENQDAAAELCNQIFGHAKKVLNEKGHTISPAIPAIITGKNHKIRHLIDGVCIVVSFATPKGNFVVETVTKSK